MFFLSYFFPSDGKTASLGPTLVASAWCHTLISSISSQSTSSSSASTISFHRFSTNLLARCQKELAYTLHWAGLADQPSGAHSFITAGYGRLKTAIEVLAKIQSKCLVVAERLKGWQGAFDNVPRDVLDLAALNSREPMLAWLAVSLRGVEEEEEEVEEGGTPSRSSRNSQKWHSGDDDRVGAGSELLRSRDGSETDEDDVVESDDCSTSTTRSTRTTRTSSSRAFPLGNCVKTTGHPRRSSKSRHDVVTALGLAGLTIDGEVIAILPPVQQTRSELDHRHR